MMYLSDDINHDFHAVNTFTEDAISSLKKITCVHELVIWSDGCVSQYKTSQPTQTSQPSDEGRAARNFEVMASLSDDINHDFHVVNTFTEDAISSLKKITCVDELVIWSDGCASQYKDKGTFVDLSLMQMKVQRCYFSSEHGKGKADGATGVLSQAMSQSVAGERSFRNASDL
ncbi:hypothetical protein ElyMa_006971800 [Elysia marginata]|uniref:Uncharacterized protein n=1 Tax=Elysia marginata TaxID=1093978 RepID=A0AAV4JQK7_9GAST|nr:hypothetical protein ElyMa_006971800 [Elysia marginata]